MVGDDQTVARQILVPKYLRTDAGLVPQGHFPSAFIFRSRDDLANRSVESVVWLDVTSSDRTLEHGEGLAAASRSRLLDRKPSAADADLDSYAGYLAASVGEIRSTTPFDVFHEPEDGQEEHCHLELLDVFEAFMAAKAEREGTNQEGPLSRKKARVAAINILIELFERQGLFRQPEFVAVPLPLSA